jgi:hypothetical protein
MYNITLFSSTWHILSALIIFIAGFIVTIPLSKHFNIGTKIGGGLYLYHSLFCMVYLFYVINFSGDAIGYFKVAMLPLPDFKPGTIGLYYFVSYLHKLDLSIAGCFLIFNLFGCIGLLVFYSSLKSITFNSSTRIKRIVLLVVFLPSVSFWSSGLGKDAISFMAMGLALYAALNFDRRIWIMAIAIGLMLFVRPHMAAMLVIAISISIVIQKNIPLLPRILVGTLALAVSTVMIPFALNYAGVSEDASNLQSYIVQRANSNLGGGSSLDIASMPLPVQMFTYLFRPLPVEARSITQLLASIDNMLLLYLFYVGFKVRKKVKNIQLKGSRVFMWSYVAISWVILSMTTANLGIAMRQKWMFTPILIFLLISMLAAAEKKRMNKY